MKDFACDLQSNQKISCWGIAFSEFNIVLGRGESVIYVHLIEKETVLGYPADFYNNQM